MNEKFQNLPIIEQLEYIQKQAIKLNDSFESLRIIGTLVNNYNEREFALILKMNQLENLILSSKLPDAFKLALIKDVINIYQSNTLIEPEEKTR